MCYYDKLLLLCVVIFDLNIFVVVLIWEYQEDWMMYGISVNMLIGDWVVGMELLYWLKDLVMFNLVIDLCIGNGGKCWKDEKKFQWYLIGLYSFMLFNFLMFLDFSGVSMGSLLIELVVIKYLGLYDEVNGELFVVGFNVWQLDFVRVLKFCGDKIFLGINLDFSLIYDGILLLGWQVMLGVFYVWLLGGWILNFSVIFIEDVSSMNLYLNFVWNLVSWQIFFNYVKFMGGEMFYDQFYCDCDYVGIVIFCIL